MILRGEQVGCIVIEPLVERRGLLLSMPHPDEGERPIECQLHEQDIRHLRDLLTEALDD